MMNTRDIQAARDRIRDGVFLTPCARSEILSYLTGCDIYLKLENLQMTGSFKDRGALNKLLCLSEAERAAGVIAASAGNHAQGVAHAARLLGIKAVIVMPETTALSKIRGTQEWAAEIVLHGAGYDAAYAKAVELQQAHGYTFVHAFNDADVIAAQGTIGLELLEQVPDMDVVVVPVGGGGLIGGIATAIKHSRPEVDIIGVEAERLPAMQQSLRAGRITPQRVASTLADGIAIAHVGELTFPLVQQYVSRIVTVSEDEIASAVMTLLEREKTLAEGGGAVGFAAVYEKKIEGLTGKKVVIVISGGNIDMNLLERIIDRGLEADGRLMTLRVVVPDKPGSIAQLANIVAEHSANIFTISQTRPVSDVQLGETEVELLLETRGHEHDRQITKAISAVGFVLK